MWNQKKAETALKKLPALYATEETPINDHMIGVHFFLGGSDWYIAEYDPAQRLMFGFVILNQDTECAEWGYTSFDELCGVRQGTIEVDFDLYWQPCKFSEIRQVQFALEITI